MLPHGGRPADSPRVSTDDACSANASTVRETATRPSRLALPRRAASSSVTAVGTGTSYAGEAPTATSSRSGCSALPAARRAERELGRVAVHRDRVDRHRGVEQVVAEVGQRFTGHRQAPVVSSLVNVVRSRSARPARGPRRSGPRRPQPRSAPAPPPRRAYARRRRPQPGPRPAGAARTGTSSGRPAPAARTPAPGPAPGSRAIDSDVQRRTPSIVIVSPDGSVTDVCGASPTTSLRPSFARTWVRPFLSRLYTDCGVPLSTPRSPV